MKDTVRISVAIDYGNGNVVQHAFNVPIEVPKEKPKKKEPELKTGDIIKDENGEIEVVLKRREFEPEFSRFIQTGDITELKLLPNHRELLKPCVFAQIYGIKGRTVYANKPTRVNSKYVGILPPDYFDDDFCAEIKRLTDAEQVINVVFLDDRSKPAIVHDIALVENWATLAHAFNSLYREPRNG